MDWLVYTRVYGCYVWLDFVHSWLRLQTTPVWLHTLICSVYSYTTLDVYTRCTRYPLTRALIYTRLVALLAVTPHLLHTRYGTFPAGCVGTLVGYAVLFRCVAVGHICLPPAGSQVATGCCYAHYTHAHATRTRLLTGYRVPTPLHCGRGYGSHCCH